MHRKYGWASLPWSQVQSVINQTQKASSDCFHCLLTHSFQFSFYPLSFPLCILAALHRVLQKGKTQYESNAYQNATFWHFRTTSSDWGVSKRHTANVPKVVIRDSTAFTLTSINKIKCLLVSWLPCPNANSLVFLLFCIHFCYLGHVHVMTGQHSRIIVCKSKGGVHAHNGSTPVPGELGANQANVHD